PLLSLHISGNRRGSGRSRFGCRLGAHQASAAEQSTVQQRGTASVDADLHEQSPARRPKAILLVKTLLCRPPRTPWVSTGDGQPLGPPPVQHVAGRAIVV